jgi:hypothetical protein
MTGSVIGSALADREVQVSNLDQPQKASRLYRGLTVPVNGEKAGAVGSAFFPSKSHCEVLSRAIDHSTLLRFQSLISRRTNLVKVREEYDALLFVWVGACDDRNAVFGCAGIVGQVWRTGRNIDKISGSGGKMIFKLLAVPHSRFAAQSFRAAIQPT